MTMEQRKRRCFLLLACFGAFVTAAFVTFTNVTEFGAPIVMVSAGGRGDAPLGVTDNPGATRLTQDEQSQLADRSKPLLTTDSVQLHEEPPGGAVDLPEEGIQSEAPSAGDTNNTLSWIETHENIMLNDSNHITDVTNCQWNVTLSADGADSWNVVTNDTLFVYSAYQDPRFRKSLVIKVFGLVSKTLSAEYESRPYFCRMWLSGGKSLASVARMRQILARRKKERFNDVVFSCGFPLSKVKVKDVSYVTISRDPCDEPSFVMTMHRTLDLAPGDYPRDFTVCLSGPLKFQYSNYSHFVAWIELNRIFGAQKFFIYNNTVDDTLKPYIDYYVRNDVMELLEWNLPAGVTDRESIWNYGQLIMFNECVFRNMFQTKFVVSMDLDEIVVPRAANTTNWKELLVEQGCFDKEYVNVRNAFFRSNFPDDAGYENASLAYKYQLVFLLKTHRQPKYLPYKMRSKYLVRPEYVLSAMVHHAYLVGGAKSNSCVLDPEVGALHHYRPFNGKGKDDKVLDRVIHRYGNEMIKQVRRTHNSVGNVI